MSDTRSRWPEPRWLEPHENPFGIRVLDCRAPAFSTTFYTTSKELVEEWLRRANGDGEEYRDRGIDHPVVVSCDFKFRCADDPAEGLIFAPAKMEDLWLIYRFGNWLSFVNAQDGKVELRAWHTHETSDGSHLKITRVEANPRFVGDCPSHGVKTVDFLIKSHLASRVAPHPLPPWVKDKLDDQIHYSVEVFGRRGFFGTFEETVGLPWLEWEYAEFMKPLPTPPPTKEEG